MTVTVDDGTPIVCSLPVDHPEDPAASVRSPGRGPREWFLRRRGPILSVLGAAVVAMVIGVVSSIMTPASPSRPEPNAIGDPRSADPCALLEPTSLSAYGTVVLDPAYGGFDRCDLLVDAPDAGRIADVKVDFSAGGQELGSNTHTRRVGGFTVVLEPNSGKRECTQLVRLGADRQLAIVAKQLGSRPADLCAIADITTARAIPVMERGPIPRRPSASAKESLARLDACAMLDPATLDTLSGIDPSEPDAGFANWSCRRRSTVDNGGVEVRFDQNVPLTAQDGLPRRLGDRKAFVSPGDGDDAYCVVKVEHRTYVNVRELPVAEVVELKVSGPRLKESLCDTAVELAAAVVGKLPKI
ncbi:hypothetical protein ACIRL2_27675 [Embleya sp. NPDC127516]|uniref:hypothetical protein n=1 Tax=Embleya sp. NPDC127516 TaxID=3363990 RepID=UPI00380EEF98